MTKHSKSKDVSVVGPRKLHCFVAMAFGRSDTDALYSQHITKAIQDAGMIPVRVDKVIHNERIDIKIRNLIEKADVVIADLTYARPSAYWEAGYAERKVPVIYTCRQDHLHAQPTDTYGNFLVHFDLRNANLITWTGMGSKQFQKNLKQRLIYVTKQLRIELAKDIDSRVQRNKFSELSTNERKGLVHDETILVLRAHGFVELSYSAPGSVSFFSNSGGRILRLLYWKLIRSVALIVLISSCFVDFTISERRRLNFGDNFDFASRYPVIWEDLPKAITSLTQRKVRSIRRLILVPSLGTITDSRIDKIYPSWRRIGENLHYFNPQIDVPAYMRMRDQSHKVAAIPSSSELLLIGGIKSILEYRTFLSETIRVVQDDNSAIIALSE
jgi:nucleoside 2-deoxyribosyltransferase